MNVLIFEPWHTGHRLEYAKRLVPAIKELNVKLTIASTHEAFSSPEFDIHLTGLSSNYERYELPSLSRHSKLRTRLQVKDHLCQAVLELQPDHILVPSADLVDQVLLMLPSRVRDRFPPMEGLHLFGGFGYARRSILEQLRERAESFIAARARWCVYFHLDPWQLSTLCRRHRSLSHTALVMPDPVDPPIEIQPEAARNELGIPIDATYVGIAGPMTLRKGIDRLIRAFSAVRQQLPSNARLLLAGPLDDTLRSMLQVDYREVLHKDAIILVDRHLSAREMSLAIPCMDIVCVPYPFHVGSSGIALRAAASQRPLLTNNRFWLQNIVKAFGLGDTCDVLDQVAFERGLITSFQNLEHYQRPERASRYLQFQTPDNFVATWTDQIRRRCGLPPNTRRIHWESVLADND